MTVIGQRALSPFSLEHEWEIEWSILPSNTKIQSGMEITSQKEKRALMALAAVGLIGSLQLTRIFGLDKKRIRRMEGQKRVVRHILLKKGRPIPFFSLGPAAGRGIIPYYELNYWQCYAVEDILKRMLFFQLYGQFPDDTEIIPAAAPFTGVILHKGNPFYVYVERGGMQDLLLFLKWKKVNDRILLITESLNHLEPLDSFLQDGNIKIRATTDLDMGKGLQSAFSKDSRNKTGSIQWLSEG